MAGESDTFCDPFSVGPYLEYASDFHLPVNSILQDQSQNSSPPMNFPCHNQHYM